MFADAECTHVKLIDFGQACALPHYESPMFPGARCGKLSYMAREVRCGVVHCSRCQCGFTGQVDR